MKLTKPEYRAHAEACERLEKDFLKEDDRWFVLENWHEGATNINSSAGAFFTPPMLARDLMVELSGTRIIDLCAGIGTLAFLAWNRSGWGREPCEIVCVEKNPDYVAVGRKVLPEATWIEADVFDLPGDLGGFDYAIGNPPFGATPRTGAGPRYTGRAFEYHVLDVASDLANDGVFIIPQESASFRYSGRQRFEEVRLEPYLRFAKETGIELSNNCGLDTEAYRSQWRGVSPAVEIVLANFREARQRRLEAAAPLFARVT